MKPISMMIERVKAAASAAANLPEPDGLSSPSKFFGVVRSNFYRLRQSQVDGINAILGACADADWNVSWTAYALATAWHETAATMQPIKEYGGDAYFMRMYDKTGRRPHVAKRLGNTEVGDGKRFPGRGYVQLTGRRNHQLMKDKLGVDLIGNPALAQDPVIAARVMISGMQDGDFTGKALHHYLPNDNGVAPLGSFINARRIINGTDRAKAIANHAVKFQSALIAGGWRP